MRKIDNIEVIPEREHYVILVDGKFHCSCDNMREVDEEIDELLTQ